MLCINQDNVLGQVVTTWLVGKKVDISSLEKGIYVLQVEDVYTNKNTFKLMIN